MAACMLFVRRGCALRSSVSTGRLALVACRRCCSTSSNDAAARINPWKSDAKAGTVSLFSGGRPMSFTCGKLARFADGCATAQFGDTTVMATVVSKSQGYAQSFLPLTVDYRQKGAAVGRIPTNVLRRELGPTNAEILTSRVIDRSVRPLFPSGFNFETQIMCNLLAADGSNDPDVASINAASAALAISDIPWDGPVAAVRVGIIDKSVVVNPTRQEMADSTLDMIIAANELTHVVMIEASGDNVPVEEFRKAVKIGAKECNLISRAIAQLQRSYGKVKRTRTSDSPENASIGNSGASDVCDHVRSLSSEAIRSVLLDFSHDKFSRDAAIKAIKKDTMAAIKGNNETSTPLVPAVAEKFFDDLVKTTLRNLILDEGVRCDGRGLTELRDIKCQIDLHKPLHGSALFQRGQTQVFCAVTFDSLDAMARMDPITEAITGPRERNFMLHYEFPPYATNEIGRPGATSRRELGHGALAEKSLRCLIPEDFPFTIRLTSEVLESNGSSSMASVCGGSLALMDAGVPIAEHAAGIAIGLVTRADDDEPNDMKDYKLLTDIMGMEDYAGDMDFKMAGTKKGITGLQADIKIKGLPLRIVMDAIQRARDGTHEILKIMYDCIQKPRQVPKDNRPVTEKLEVTPVQRARLLGVGWSNVKKLNNRTGVRLTVNDENTFELFAPNVTSMSQAKVMIDELLSEEREPVLEFGAVCTAKIVEVRDVGVMVQLHPRLQPALLHNSQLDTKLVRHPSALDLKVGQELQVKYFGRDPANGTMRLSRKVLFATSGSDVPRKLGTKSAEQQQASSAAEFPSASSPPSTDVTAASDTDKV